MHTAAKLFYFNFFPNNIYIITQHQPTTTMPTTDTIAVETILSAFNLNNNDVYRINENFCKQPPPTTIVRSNIGTNNAVDVLNKTENLFVDEIVQRWNNNRDEQRANKFNIICGVAAANNDSMYGDASSTNARNYNDDDDELKSMLYGNGMKDNKLSDDGRMISANASKLVLDINNNNNKDKCGVVNSNWRFGSINIMS